MGISETFKALASPERRQILELLKKNNLSVGEIGKYFSMSNATLSYHLKVLKKADLITENKHKNFIYYELNTSVVEGMLAWFSSLKGIDNDENK